MGSDNNKKKKKFGALDNENPLWQRILLGILKNLVYIFALIIVAAFGIMLVVVYTDTNMTDFLKNDKITVTKAMVDPLFGVLEANLDLDRHFVPKMDAVNIWSPQVLNKDYLIKNKPVIMPSMAKSWPAVSKWSDKQYFINEVGSTTCVTYALSNYNLRNRTESTAYDFSMFQSHYYQQPTTFGKAIYKLNKNDDTK